MKHFEQLTRKELTVEILRVVEYLCRSNRDGYPCLYRKNYRKLFPNILEDIDGAVREAMKSGLLEVDVCNKKGYGGIKLTERGKKALHPAIVSENCGSQLRM